MSLLNKARVELRIGGHGGQGVILAGQILGRAATLFDRWNATTTQSYGPEARGGACNSSIVLSQDPVLYPYVTRPDSLILFSREAYDKFGPELAPDGVLVIEEGLLGVVEERPGVEIHSCPAIRIAEEMGVKIAANVVLLGMFVAATGLLSKEAVEESIGASLRPHTVDAGLRCFAEGYSWYTAA
jgi:2-oxoglutarate ferredoxin oxidoreductase subunit gamma